MSLRRIGQFLKSLAHNRFQAAGAILLLLAAALLMLSYWPGIITWDPIEQYDQAVQEHYFDWHPPIMAWIWHFLIPIYPGTAPMFVLQVSLYLGGYGLLVLWALRRGQASTALAFAACALLPIPLALMGSVLKDCLMTGALGSAVGLFVLRGKSRNPVLPIVAIVLLLLATALRFNAFPATAPFVVALLPASWRTGWVRLAGTSLVTLLVLLSVPPLINRALQVERTGVEYTQLIFDLAGITENSGVDAFPPLPARDPVAVVHKCYSAEMWDSFSSWDDPPKCRINFNGVRKAFAVGGKNPALFWLHAVATHPLAYAEHRLNHLAINFRLTVPKVNYQPAPDHSIENGWNFVFHPNAVQSFINDAAVATDHSPLGWPLCWLALMLGILAISPGLPSGHLIVPIGLSVTLYACSYAVISVASDLRYHLWTMVGTCVAGVLAGADLANGAHVSAKRLFAAATPLVVAITLCLIARLA